MLLLGGIEEKEGPYSRIFSNARKDTATWKALNPQPVRINTRQASARVPPIGMRPRGRAGVARPTFTSEELIRSVPVIAPPSVSGFGVEVHVTPVGRVAGVHPTEYCSPGIPVPAAIENGILSEPPWVIALLLEVKLTVG